MPSSSKSLIAATSTPLASIFGSGFLVIVPILAGVLGEYSVFAMAAVSALAYVVGTMIRFNIKHAEPVLAFIAVFAVPSSRREEAAVQVSPDLGMCA